MQTRQLGPGGPVSSAVAFGAMALTGIYGAVSETDAQAALREVRQQGITHIDTAEVYGGGENERTVGHAIAGYRDAVLLATKFNPRQYADVVDRPWERVIDESIEGSLRRLGTDHVDVWYLHRVPIDRPIEETWGPMSRAVERGQVRFLGLSEASATTIRRAHLVHPVTVLQSEWSLLTREIEDEILPTVRELEIGFVAYSPLSRGLLGGRIRTAADLPEGDWRGGVPRFRGGDLDANLAIVDRLAGFAAARGISLAQLALAWLLAQGDDVVPLVGARHARHVADSAASADVVLAPADLAELDRIAPRGATSGDRYPAEYLPGLVR